MGSVKLLLNMHFSGDGTNGTLCTVFSFNSSCLGKKEVLLPDFLILYALFWEISFLCKALGNKVNSVPFLSAWVCEH